MSRTPATHADALAALTADTSYAAAMGWPKSYISRTPIDRHGRPLPWYSYAASHFIGRRLTRAMHVYEFGAGFSTLWYAARVFSVISVESKQQWIQRLSPQLPANVELHHAEGDAYAGDVLQYADRFDVLCIDGIDRVACAKNSLSALRAGGVIVWDNADRKADEEGYLFLADNGFRRIDFASQIPVCTGIGFTTVFYRTGNVFNI